MVADGISIDAGCGEERIEGRDVRFEWAMGCDASADGGGASVPAIGAAAEVVEEAGDGGIVALAGVRPFVLA